MTQPKQPKPPAQVCVSAIQRNGLHAYISSDATGICTARAQRAAQRRPHAPQRTPQHGPAGLAAQRGRAASASSALRFRSFGFGASRSKRSSASPSTVCLFADGPSPSAAAGGGSGASSISCAANRRAPCLGARESRRGGRCRCGAATHRNRSGGRFACEMCAGCLCVVCRRRCACRAQSSGRAMPYMHATSQVGALGPRFAMGFRSVCATSVRSGALGRFRPSSLPRRFRPARPAAVHRTHCCGAACRASSSGPEKKGCFRAE